MNYTLYRLSGKEFILNSLIYLLMTGLVSVLFYDSFVMFFVLIVFLPVFLKKRSKALCVKRSGELKDQFCEMIENVSASLSAGMSVDNAIRLAKTDMAKTFGDDSVIVMELTEIIKSLNVNVPLSVSLSEFSKRTGIEDIEDFVTVFKEAIKSGGNLNDIIRGSVSIIREKKKIEDEINAMLKGKLLEQKVISVIPFLIFIYLRISSAEMISVLYHNVLGISVMTICLIVYVLSYVAAGRIVNIKV